MNSKTIFYRHRFSSFYQSTLYIFKLLEFSKMKRTCLLIFIFLAAFSTVSAQHASVGSAKANIKTENGAQQPKLKEGVSAIETPPLDKSACLTAKIEGKKLIPAQTFVFDFEPFPKSCFVTFANKEDMLDDKDLPRGSTFYIYKGGKQVYQFADAFDGQPACWVEGVGFEDLNADKKVDVVIAGKCLAAKDSYPLNAVYMNVNDVFKTDSTSNQLLESFTTIKQISDFVKKNQKKFL